MINEIIEALRNGTTFARFIIYLAFVGPVVFLFITYLLEKEAERDEV